MSTPPKLSLQRTCSSPIITIDALIRGGNNVVVEMHLNKTFADLRAELENQSKIPISQQVIEFCGSPISSLPDTMLLYDIFQTARAQVVVSKIE